MQSASSSIDTAIRSRPKSRAALDRALRQAARDSDGRIPDKGAVRRRYEALVRAGVLPRSPVLENLLIRSGVRSLSGVAVVTVLTKPFPCPGKCVYCPTEAIMPKSYLSNEPAAMRALVNRFDPYQQVASRLRALHDGGHPTDKVELIVKGGTWSAYAWEYRRWFIKRAFDACNHHTKKFPRTLEASQRRNERAESRIIGLTVETRPDWVTDAEVLRLRELGVTRIELGVQSTFDEALALTKRGHDVAATRRSFRLLRDAGFKVDAHHMPQLPGTTPERDYEDVKRLFGDPDFRPDMLKLYPTVVVPSAELHDWWKQGRYVPYSDEKLIETMIRVKSELIPRYCRISRLIRDIPSTSIAAGNAVTNLREVIQERMRERGLACRCLRCREAGRTDPEMRRTPRFFDLAYDASAGVEHFLSFEDRARRAVYAFCRLRLAPNGRAFIRELHTYGHLVPIGGRGGAAVQHRGLGRRLMREAERIARAAGYATLEVISGIGVRGYYRALGYRLKDTYMVKRLG